MQLKRAALILTFTALAACGPSQTVDEASLSTQQDGLANPIAKGGGTLLNRPQTTPSPYATTGNGINYNGGPIMTAGVNLYLIWYGNWSGNSAQSIIPDWASNIGGSPHFNVNTTYDDASNNHVKNVVTYAGVTTDSYSQGSSLNDGSIYNIVSSAINGGRLPLDSNGLYFVLTSADVNETTGFCTSYCGWHTYGGINGVNIKYSFVGNSDRCLSACAAQTTSPNGNAGADGMISVLTHELEETATDPLINAWYDSGRAENGDKCAWNFGPEYTTGNGAHANQRLGSRDYLIQQNWLNANGGGCVQTWNPGVPFGVNVSLTARANLNYVCADNNGNNPLIANRGAVGLWETFQFIDLGGGNVAIKALVNNLYVCADNGGSSPLIANRGAIGLWETFQYIDLGNGFFALKSAVNGLYVTADNGGNSALIANRGAIGPWEMFHWDRR